MEVKKWLESVLLPTLQEQIAGVKVEMANLRTEVKGEMSQLRNEMIELKSEVTAEITGLRSEFKEDIGELRTDFRVLKNDVYHLERVTRLESRVDLLEKQSSPAK